MPRRSGRSSSPVGFQLAKLAKVPPRGSGFLTELKFDGYRIAAEVDGALVRLLSRGGHDYTAQAPGVVDALRALKLRGALLDGELCAVDPNGRTDFGLLQRTMGSRALIYVVFDALALAGSDVRALPLVERKRQLAQHIEVGAVLRLSEAFEQPAELVLQHACGLGLEGIVCKRRDAPYRAGEGSDWVKVKCTRSDVFWIIGYAPASVLRNTVGSLLLATREGAYAGRVGTGISGAESAKLYKMLAPHVVEAAAAAKSRPRGADARGIRWVQSRVFAEVRFTEFTRDGTLRHPVYHAVHESLASRFTEG